MTRQGLKNHMMGTSTTSRLRLQLVAAEYLERMGQRMRLRREHLGMTRGDVARAMPGKTNENAIYRWEKGLHRPEDDALEALASVLQVTGAGWFFADELKDPDAPTPSPFAGQDGTADQFDAITARLERIEANQTAMLSQLGELQDALSGRVEAVDEHLARLALAVVEGRPPEEDAQGHPPARERRGGAARKRAAKPRTP
jgi:transcriptional regulator with XRE-family HTH domain